MTLEIQTVGTLCDLFTSGYRRSLFHKVLYHIDGHSKGTFSRQLKEMRHHRVNEEVFSSIFKQIIQVTSIRMSRTISFHPDSNRDRSEFPRSTAADRRLMWVSVG